MRTRTGNRIGRVAALVALLGAGLQMAAAPPAHAAEGTFSLTAASVSAAVDSGDTIDVSLSFQCVGAPGDVCSNTRIDLPWNVPFDVFGDPLPPLPASAVGSPPEVAGVTTVGATTRVALVSPLAAGTAGNVVIRFATHHLMTPGGTTYAATPVAVSDGGSTPYGSALTFTVDTPRRDDPWTLTFNPGPFLKYRDTDYTVAVDVCPDDFTGYEFIPGTTYDLTFFDDRVTVVSLPPRDVSVISTSPELVIRYHPTGFFTSCWGERLGGSLVIRFARANYTAGEHVRYDIRKDATGNLVIPGAVSGVMQIAADAMTLTHGLGWAPLNRHPGGSAALTATTDVFGNAPVREVRNLITLPPTSEFEPSQLSDGGYAGWLGASGNLTVTFSDPVFAPLGTTMVPSGGTVPVPPGTRYVELVWTIAPPVQPDFTLAVTIRGRIAPSTPVGGTVTAFSSAGAYAAEEPPFPVWDSITADLLVTDPIPVPGVEVRSPELGGGPRPPMTTGTVVVEVRNDGAVAYPDAFLTIRYPPEAIRLDPSGLEVIGGPPSTVLDTAEGIVRIRWDAPIPADTVFEVRIPAMLRPFSYLDTSRSVTATITSADEATDLALNPLTEPCSAGTRVADTPDDDSDGRTDGDHACTASTPLRTTRSVALAVGHSNRASATDPWDTSVTFSGDGDEAEVLLRWHNTSSMPLEVREVVWTLPALGDRRPSSPGTGRGSEFGVRLLAVPSVFVERAGPVLPLISVEVSDSTDPCPDGTHVSCAASAWASPGTLPLERVRAMRLSVSGPISPDAEFGIVARVGVDPASLPGGVGVGGLDAGAAEMLTAYSDWSTWARTSEADELALDSGRITFRYETAAGSPADPTDPDGDPDPGPQGGGGSGRLEAASPRTAGGALASTGARLVLALGGAGVAAIGTGRALLRRSTVFSRRAEEQPCERHEVGDHGEQDEPGLGRQRRVDAGLHRTQ